MTTTTTIRKYFDRRGDESAEGPAGLRAVALGWITFAGLLTSGQLQETNRITTELRGRMTSNPAIFEKAHHGKQAVQRYSSCPGSEEARCQRHLRKNRDSRTCRTRATYSKPVYAGTRSGARRLRQPGRLFPFLGFEIPKPRSRKRAAWSEGRWIAAEFQ